MESQRDAQSVRAGGSVTHRLEDHALGSLAIPFAVEDALPGTQIESSRGHRDDDLVAQREGSQMSRGVVLSGARVVPIGIRLPRRDPRLEPLEDIGPQARLVVV